MRHTVAVVAWSLGCLAWVTALPDAAAAPPAALPANRPLPPEASLGACRSIGLEAAAATDDARIEALASEFQCWLAAARPRGALAALEKACGMAGDSSCSFNRAYVHHALLDVEGESQEDNCRIARDNYADYLLAEPYDAYREDATSALAELVERCPLPARPAPPLPRVADASFIQPMPPGTSLALSSQASPAASMGREPPVAREGPSSTALYTAAWLALGAGAATGVATVVSWKHLSDADSALYERVTRGTDDRQDALNNELDQERRRQLVRTWAFGVGTVLLLGAGASLLVLDAGGGSDLSFDIGGDFHGLRYHGAF